jgi:mono/diheme cytochrome c family protein
MRIPALVLGAQLAMLPVAAWAQNVGHGREVAERWCANCHVVSGEAASGQSNGLPTFPGLAARPDMTPIKLKAAMNSQHSRMPDFQIGTRDQDDLVAYILSLKKK